MHAFWNECFVWHIRELDYFFDNWKFPAKNFGKILTGARIKFVTVSERWQHAILATIINNAGSDARSQLHYWFHGALTVRLRATRLCLGCRRRPDCDTPVGIFEKGKSEGLKQGLINFLPIWNIFLSGGLLRKPDHGQPISSVYLVTARRVLTRFITVRADVLLYKPTHPGFSC